MNTVGRQFVEGRHIEHLFADGIGRTGQDVEDAVVEATVNVVQQLGTSRPTAAPVDDELVFSVRIFLGCVISWTKKSRTSWGFLAPRPTTVCPPGGRPS